MSKKIEKLFKSYRDQLLHLAKLYGVVEIKSYARSSKRLTITQLELLLIKNRIKLPENRSSDKAIAKQELKENAIRNVYLSIAFIVFLGFFITMRPYIKNIVNEVKFTYVAEDYKLATNTKSNKTKNKKIEIAKESEIKIETEHDNTVSLSAETAKNLFNFGKHDEAIEQLKESPMATLENEKSAALLANLYLKKNVSYPFQQNSMSNDIVDDIERLMQRPHAAHEQAHGNTHD